MTDSNKKPDAEAEAKAKAEAAAKEAEAKAKAEAAAKEAEAKAKAAASKKPAQGYQVLDTIRAGGQYFYEGDTLPEDAVTKKVAAQLRKNKLIK